MATSLTRLDEDLLEAPVAGSGLHEDEAGRTTLRAQLDGERPTLLLFLRHLGCVFCRQMVKDVRIASDEADAGQAEKRFPRVVFVHSAGAEQGARFFGRYWPGAPAISDREKRLYTAFGLERGSLVQLVGPAVIGRGARAMLRGHGIGRPAGDPLLMPGLFLIAPDGRILARHTFRHIGDHPDFARFADVRSWSPPPNAAKPPATAPVAGAA